MLYYRIYSTCFSGSQHVLQCVLLYGSASKHRTCNGPGRPFATRLATESGALATNPPCDQPIEDYSTLHRGLRQGFVTEGPRQRYVTEGGGGDRDKPLFRVPATYVYIYICIHEYHSKYYDRASWILDSTTGALCQTAFLQKLEATATEELAAAGNVQQIADHVSQSQNSLEGD